MLPSVVTTGVASARSHSSAPVVVLMLAADSAVEALTLAPIVSTSVPAEADSAID